MHQRSKIIVDAFHQFGMRFRFSHAPQPKNIQMKQITLRGIMEKAQGLVQVQPKIKVTDAYTLSLVYSPGVGAACMEIKNDPDTIYDYTIATNAIAIITDGSALPIQHQFELIPKLESQAAMFKFFYNIDCFPFILDWNLCKTEDDLLLIIENLSPVYKVIDLKFIDQKKIDKLLPKLKAKNLPITVLYRDLWKDIHYRNDEGHMVFKEYMKALIVESAVVRAILDQRAHIPVGEGKLPDLVNHTWGQGRNLLQSLPNQISDSLLSTYSAALEFMLDAKLAHPSVAHHPAKHFVDRMLSFFYFGNVSFIDSWGEDHVLHKESIDENSLLLHKRYSGMIGMSPKFRPRSLEEAYKLFLRSFESDDLKLLEEAIRENPDYADVVTFKHNLAAIMTNGTAILGFGDIGPAAGLPVMEGKSVLFKSLAGIDVIPVCIKEKDPSKAVLVFKMLAPIFNAINLEDIKAPECFEIERRMIEETNIAVMHDDQHGTAVVCVAAIINGLKLMKRNAEDIKLVINGAGAAGLAICELLLSIGIKNIIICDTEGAIYEGRPKNMNDFKNKLAAITNKDKVTGKLVDVIKGSDIFIGVSVAGALKPEMVKSMNKDCFILALANPVPEIHPDEAKKAGALIVATGRSDFKNQVNNSLAFPGIFRGAMESKASRINKEMKLAAARTIANLVQERDLNTDADVPSGVARAVAEAAVRTGVAKKKNVDPDYIQDLTRKLNIEGLIPSL